VRAQRLGDADLGRAGVQLSRYALDLDGVRVIDALPPEQVPVLAHQNVDDRRLDPEHCVADPEQGLVKKEFWVTCPEP